MFTFDGIFRSLLATLDMTPEQAKEMAMKVVNAVETVQNRLTVIEEQNAQLYALVEKLEKELSKNDQSNDGTNSFRIAG